MLSLSPSLISFCVVSFPLTFLPSSLCAAILHGFCVCFALLALCHHAITPPCCLCAACYFATTPYLPLCAARAAACLLLYTCMPAATAACMLACLLQLQHAMPYACLYHACMPCMPAAMPRQHARATKSTCLLWMDDQGLTWMGLVGTSEG